MIPWNSGIAVIAISWTATDDIRPKTSAVHPLETGHLGGSCSMKFGLCGGDDQHSEEKGKDDWPGESRLDRSRQRHG